jgi:uncharacterized protein with von Willebrand factor type A (vWA) domain
MKRLLGRIVSIVSLLAACGALPGCASGPAPPGAMVDAARLMATIVPGVTTRAQLLASLGPTHHLVFDSGYETWLYRSPADAGQSTELVVLVDPRGVVSKVRRGATTVPPASAAK